MDLGLEGEVTPAEGWQAQADSGGLERAGLHQTQP